MSNDYLFKLTLTTDKDCVFYLDGVKQFQLVKGLAQELPLSPGRYTLEFISLEDSTRHLQVGFEMPTSNSTFEVDFSSKNEVVLTKKKEVEVTNKRTKAKKQEEVPAENKDLSDEADQKLKKEIKIFLYIFLFSGVSIGALWYIDSTIGVKESLIIVLNIVLVLLSLFSLFILIICCIEWLVGRIKRGRKNRKK